MLSLVVLHAAAATVCVLVACLCALMSKAPGFAPYRVLALVAICAAAGNIADAVTFYPQLTPSLVGWSQRLAISLTQLACLWWLVFALIKTKRLRSVAETTLMASLCAGAFFSLILGTQNIILGYFVVTVLAATIARLGWDYLGAIHKPVFTGWVSFPGFALWILATLVDFGVTRGFIDFPLLGLSSLALTAALTSAAIELSIYASSNAANLHSTQESLLERIEDRANELVSSREALMATERHTALGRLAAGVGHEINNPLAYVAGNLLFIQETLEGEKSPNAEDLAAIDDALEGVDRIRSIVDNLTVYARNVPSAEGSADLTRAIDIARRMVAPQTRYSMSLAVTTSSVPGLYVSIDESRLVQVLVNLLLNAAQASPKPKDESVALPKTSISCRQDGEIVRVEIQDQGCGIAEPELVKLFEPQNWTPSTEESKLGLGLLVSQGILSAADGSIQITSTEGQGTLVTIELKLASTPSIGVAA